MKNMEPGYNLGAIGESMLPWPPPLGKGKPNAFPLIWRALKGY